MDRLFYHLCLILLIAALVGNTLVVAASETKPETEKETKQETKQETEVTEKEEEPEKKADEKIAVVNKVVITKSDFEREFTSISRQLMMQGHIKAQEELLKLKADVLDSMVKRELLYQDIQTKNITVDEAGIAQQLMALRGRFPTEKEYKEALDQMGVNQEELEKRVRRDLTIQDFIKNEFTSKTEVTEKDIKTFYDSKKDQFTKPEEVKASHILLKVEAEAGEDKKKEARAKLEDVQKKIKKGEDFAALAKELSDCPSSSKGGDLGSFRKGQMVKPFEDAAFGMEAGQMSDIVETRFGYHLIKVTEKKAGGTVSFEEVKPQIEKYLTQEKVQEALDKHVGVLREASTVETFLQE